MVIATGKEDMKDLIVHQARVQIRARPQIEAVEAVEYQPAILPDEDGNGGRAAIEEVIGVQAQDAIVPTVWDVGIQMCKKAISRYANQITARNRLYTQMPATDYPDCRKWSMELLEQQL